MRKDLISETEKFIKQSFQKYPHYSFDDWSVMYNHSLTVKNIASRLARNIKCDKTLLAIGALLHDIGKTHKANKNTLHYYHEKFNLKESKALLIKLDLDKKSFQKLNKIITFKSRGVEQKIIKDADALALYADKKLYTLYIKWAAKNKLIKSIERKLNKFAKLNFPASRKLGARWHKQMQKDWKNYLKSKNFKLSTIKLL